MADVEKDTGLGEIEAEFSTSAFEVSNPRFEPSFQLLERLVGRF